LFTSFANSTSGLEHVDVSAAVLAAQQAGDDFIGFRLSTTTDSRYLLGPPFTQAGPSLTVEVIPEPGTLTLLAIGAIGIAAYGWRRQMQAKAKAASKTIMIATLV
jgi:hypothetical protein